MTRGALLGAGSAAALLAGCALMADVLRQWPAVLWAAFVLEGALASVLATLACDAISDGRLRRRLLEEEFRVDGVAGLGGTH